MRIRSSKNVSATSSTLAGVAIIAVILASGAFYFIGQGDQKFVTITQYQTVTEPGNVISIVSASIVNTAYIVVIPDTGPNALQAGFNQIVFTDITVGANVTLSCRTLGATQPGSPFTCTGNLDSPLNPGDIVLIQVIISGGASASIGVKVSA